VISTVTHPPCSARPRVFLDTRGLTLLEVMIAALIMIVVMFWLAQYYVLGRRHLDYDEDRRKATVLAQARLDQARRWSYSYLAGWVGGAPHDTVMAVDGKSYTIRLLASAGPNPNTVTVSAVVNWDATLPYARNNAYTASDTTTTLIARPVLR
jgi:Tfp pilus assembly protein PilV